MRQVYIAGPMSGYPEHNFPAFTHAEGVVRAAGFEPVNPATINPCEPGTVVTPGGALWREFMRKDIKALVDCYGIYMLVGWQASKGASLEHDIAVRLGLVVVYQTDAQGWSNPC